MKLVTVQVKLFRNILDSSEVSIQDDVTCLVGKNESGKTAFLHALYRLNPARSNVEFYIPDHYPAWLEKRDRLEGINLENVRPVKATFLLDKEEIEEIEQIFGEGVLLSEELILQREYNGKLLYTLRTDQKASVKNFLSGVTLPQKLSSETRKARNIDELLEFIGRARSRENVSGDTKEDLAGVEKTIREILNGNTLDHAIWLHLEKHLPEFFYFDKYSALPYSVDIRRLLTALENQLSDDELTARSLLRLAAADNEYLMNPDYERRKRELENVANALTEDVLTYWSQNPNLRVLPDISQKTQNTPQGQQSVLHELKFRIWDDRHLLSLPFSEHSSGFQWFFSFLAAFSEFEFRENPVIILLDEPALGLHAKAQKDFLRFIDERLAPRHQVIHTTHSPFMIQPDKLERVRIVEDRGREKGAQISSNVLSTDPDTLFPLQGALGYDLVQHLFIAPHNLVVEGTSDYTYLRVMSDFLKEQERIHLDDRWSVIPVGGVDLIPTFVSLLGHHLNVTVLIDARKGGHQRLSKLADEGYLEHQRIVTVGQVLDKKLADIEDVFTVSDYLLLYNRAFGANIEPDDLSGTDPILSRIARQLGVDHFDHGRPADALLRHRDELLPSLSEDTLTRFEKLFERINATLPVET
jgi:predicted ATP-dependent endonuclease of OLD family